MKKKLVFLFDVDNTLLDNDCVTADLKLQLEREVGHERQELLVPSKNCALNSAMPIILARCNATEYLSPMHMC